MSKELTPEVTWAQRSHTEEPTKNYVFLTIVVPDVEDKDLKCEFTPTSLSYKATNKKGAVYKLDIDLFGEIDVENTKTHHTARATECIIRKKELKEEYWPRLVKEKGKLHWLKTDFDKWVDEDEQEGAPEEPGFGAMGGDSGAMFGGGGDAGGFGGIDFSKLGAGQDLAGLTGNPSMSGIKAGMGDADSDDGEDEEMPDLEDAKDEPAAAGDSAAPAESKPKIEEVA